MADPAPPLPLDDFIRTLRERHREPANARARGPSGPRLKRRLEARMVRLEATVAALPDGVAAEFIGLDWLEQNRHVVREAVAQIADHLPRGYVRKLPAVDDARGTVKLRVLDLAEALVARAALPLDIGWIQRFLNAYQQAAPMTLGELWALPTFLRVIVVDRLCEAAEQGLRLAGDDVDESRQVQISTALPSAILSLRTLAACDWRTFVERVSRVEHILRNDPSGCYPQMDRDSRNRYRERVERLGRRLRRPEWGVAEAAVALSRAAAERPQEPAAHVGYYLVDRGRTELARRLRGGGRRARPAARPPSDALRTLLFVSAVAIPAAVALMLLWRYLQATDTGSAARALLLAGAAVPLLTVSTELVNWLVTQVLPPRVLPKLDFSAGIPADLGTAVAVPCILDGAADIDRLLARLEIDFLGNDDARLRFVLLSDYADADVAERDQDERLLEHARRGVDALNARYGADGLRPFALFHRRRLWNENVGRWMGWERKRGKIEEFNRWLLGADDTSFDLLHGDTAALRAARYVITLDADNQLLPGTAAELVGTLAHPLNRARFDERSGRVNAGYTVIQPRVDIHPASANRTLFSRIVSGDVGIDLYHLAVSELYQDLFGQGIYAGKGIYDVQAFTRSVAGRVPPNAVLSHDLLEGLLGRAALASDIVVLENASPNLTTELKRQHRWIRGDWQLLPWLLPVPQSRVARRDVDLLGRWKLFDNLRRSLLPASLFVLLPASWLLLPQHAAQWTLAISLVPALPIVLSVAGELRNAAVRWGTLRSSLIRIAGSFGRQLGRWLFRLCALPVVAGTTLDAIARTLLRVFVTRRHMLEWVTAAHGERGTLGAGLGATCRRMALAPAAGLLALTVAAVGDTASAWPAAYGVAWLLSPALLWLTARERERVAGLGARERSDLRKLARRTWRFYDRFVGPETHWLPPDNFQEAPKVALAERTSPTNIGLFLLSAVSAHDFGYVSALGLLTRIDGTTNTMLAMKKFRGHLFNWYSTRDLSVLPPDYVSTVDSGNLLAALFVCRAALTGIEDAPLAPQRAGDALGDIVGNIEDMVATDIAGEEPAAGPLAAALADIRQRLDETGEEPETWSAALADICDPLCADLDRAVLALAEDRGPAWPAHQLDALRGWIVQLRHEARQLHADVGDVQGCLELAAGRHDGGDACRTLGQFRAALAGAASRHEANGGEPGSQAVRTLLDTHDRCAELFRLRDRLIARIDGLVEATDFDCLFDGERNLFHIGYNNTSGELDPGYYDLLASEARIASLVAIAKGDVPIRHWVHLGRPLRRLHGMRVVLSWSATAFEYLMPRLFMTSPPHGLLDASCQVLIREQRRLAPRRDLPWGVSESAYYELDSSGHYKYQAFGVASLALRVSPRTRYVVSPYASILALPYQTQRVLQNLERLRALGCQGRYGLYEALDFGDERRAPGRPRLVQSFMAHHQGMILAALANAVCDDALVRRFHANAEIAAVEHLLYEALPKRARDRVVPRLLPPRARRMPIMTADHLRVEHDALDRHVNVLGNDHMTARVTARGGGDIAWNGRAITRWQPRVAGPMGGDRIYLSVGGGRRVQIIGAGEPLEVWAAPHQSELHQHVEGLIARVTVGVAADSDVAMKRVTLTNDAPEPQRIVLTHYAEPVLAPSAEDRRHPAFNKLFLATEFAAREHALVFSRRRRGADEAGLCCAFGVVASDAAGAPSFVTDRADFIGRDGSYRRPAAFDRGTDGRIDTLDPVAAVSVPIRLAPAATAQVVFLTAVSPDRQQALELLAHFDSLEHIAFALDQARTRAAAELTELRIESAKMLRLAERYGDLLWPQPFARRALPVLAGCDSVLSFLWSHGISGDHPICLVALRHRADAARAAEMLILQNYLGRRDVPVDLVFTDETPASYAAPLRHELDDLIAKYRDPHRPGGAFVLPVHRLRPSERAALEAAALIRIDSADSEGAVAREHVPAVDATLPTFIAVRRPGPDPHSRTPPPDAPALEFANGYGGLDAETGDYVIDVDIRSPTPAPWVNVLANPQFGCIVSERGSSCSWYQNSSEQRLTPWYNDPVTDRTGEALYVRDEETGEYWSPTPGPTPGGRHYRVRHGAGFTAFEHSSHRLDQRVHCAVDCEHPVKYLTVRLCNTADRPRRLTLTWYLEWVWGTHPEDTGPFVVTELAGDGRALLARNLLPRFGSRRTAFVTATAPLHGHTTDRREFLGPERDPSRPAGLGRIGFSERLVAGAEPCCAYQVHVDLLANGEAEVTLSLGAGEDRSAAVALAARARRAEFVAARRAASERHWCDLLGRCRIRTPNRALDRLFNHWLPYQNLAGRLWGRSGLYQSAGGFGFRDQLQDSLGLVQVAPELARAQILKACGAQFPEGDVLHWWHEGPTRGVRTRCADDLLWLPYAVSEYLRVTGDPDLLDETVPWLAGDPLQADELERYTEFAAGDRSATVYEHCARALEARESTGAHGLPLFGTGDWNDGMNRVGVAGRGESAWLGWFLADLLQRYAALAEERGEAARAAELRRRGQALVDALERHAWDGDWYLRGYYDDGASLGAAADTECRIDLNAQTWPLITGLAQPQRAERALDAAAAYLIDEERRLIRLLAPPFDRSRKDPGYIRGYPPGVRENGGQYTHAAVWAVWAAVRAGRPEQAMHWLDLLNPLLRVTDAGAARRYRGEPYVLPGDVAGIGERAGQAGWTWYTGSAAWMYRIVLEHVLGLQVCRGELRLRPAVPRSWDAFAIDLAAGKARYSIRVAEPAAIRRHGAALELDGQPCERVLLEDDGRAHRVEVRPQIRAPAREPAVRG